MSDVSEDRIHPATPARQQTIWRDGDFARSFELAAAIQLLGGLLIALTLFGSLGSWLKTMMLAAYSTPDRKVESIVGEIQSILFSSLGILSVIGIATVGVGILSHWCQTGLVFLGNKLSPDVSRLSPRQWFAKLFSGGNLVVTGTCLPKILCVLMVLVGGCWIYREQFFALGSLPANELGEAILNLTLVICGPVGGVLLIGAGVDYWMKYRSYQKRIRMTDQELREETKMQSRKGSRSRKN
jgi:flagellar biosynthesis protein FlhB